MTTKPIALLQLTDPHLMETPKHLMLGVNTDDSFQQVLAAALEDEAADLIVMTGDISGCESASSYQRMAAYMSGCSVPSVWLAGNHDSSEILAKEAGQYLSRSIEVGNWLIVTLNSATPGLIGGALSDAELKALSDVLNASNAENVLLAVHHHAINIGCRWLDGQKIANADQLFAVIENDTRVRGIIHGHVHQEFDATYEGIRLLATPSTWAQFAANCDEFTVDPKAKPGYRVLNLHASGKIDTQVKRVDVNLELDLNVTYY